MGYMVILFTIFKIILIGFFAYVVYQMIKEGKFDNIRYKGYTYKKKKW